MNITIEGNIGTGKSSVLQMMEKISESRCEFDFHYEIRPEPVEAWTLLPYYYENKEKYAFALQAQIVTSYSASNNTLADLENSDTFSNKKEHVIVKERSASSAVEVFSAMLFDQGLLTETNLSCLRNLFMELPIEKEQEKLIVYLDLDPEICLERIRKRNRPFEQSIDLEYLREVQKYYERYVAECEKIGIPVIRISSMKTTHEIFAEIEQSLRVHKNKTTLF